MGMLVKRNKAGKYRFWSTISDGHLTGWMERDEAVEYLIERARRRLDDEIESIKRDFPRGYSRPSAPGERPGMYMYNQTDAELKEAGK